MRAAAAALTMLALTLPAGGEAAKRAELRLQSVVPLVVRGAAFGPNELVRLTAKSPGRPTRRTVVLANGRGAFVALFPLVLDRCTRFTVRASGARGSRAVLQATPRCPKPKPKPGKPKGVAKG